MSSFGPGWVGRTLSNRYKIEAILGRGGMSSVYRAHDPNLNRKVAVKIIHQHLTDNAEFIQRFEQEAALIAQLRHPNIIQVHDFNHDGNTYYMVMEYIPGETLSQRLEALKNAGMRLPLVDTIRIMTKICDAADYAHQHRMIHRDLKPANVMLDLLGEPTLMDFGIARLVEVNPKNSAAGLPLGTAAYMSPELVQGEDADHRSDIYSLGIMLFEMLSGDPPFHDDSTYQIMFKQVNEPVPNLQAVEMNTPQSLITIVERALAKDPNGRFQTAGEMNNALKTVGLQLQGPADNLAGRHLDRLSLMWQQAHDLFDERQWIACINKLDDLSRTDPDYQHQKVVSLRDDALHRLAKQAERDHETGKFVESLAAIEALRTFDPEFPVNELEFKVQMGMQKAELRQQLDALYQNAVGYLEARNYEQALANWHSIQLQREGLDYPDKFMVEKRAKEGFCTALYTEAMAALTNEEPELALAKISQIKQVDPHFPDSQNVAARAKEMANNTSHSSSKTRYGLWAGAAVLLLLFVGGAVFLPKILSGSTAVSPTATNQAAIALSVTETATATVTKPPTNTATAVPSHTATAVSTNTATPRPTATSEPAMTPTTSATEEPSYRATVLENISIFTRPDATAQEVTVIMANDEIWILGRSQSNNWLYVTDSTGTQQGFASAERIDWQGDMNLLPVLTEAISSPAPEQNATSAQGNLVLTLYQLDGTQRCSGDGESWSIEVYIEGTGGNGRYSYYWNDELLLNNTNGSHTFTVSSGGAPVIGRGRVVSSDGSLQEAELFLSKPNCNDD